MLGIPSPSQSARFFRDTDGGGSAKGHAYADGGTEPPLAELLGDPIMHALLESDGLHPDDVLGLIDAVRARL
jgi:hypothetical protein